MKQISIQNIEYKINLKNIFTKVEIFSKVIINNTEIVINLNLTGFTIDKVLENYTKESKKRGSFGSYTTNYTCITFEDNTLYILETYEKIHNKIKNLAFHKYKNILQNLY